MYKVSFVNPNFQQGPKEFNAYYLPYSVAVLWSYAIQFESINNNFTLGDIIWKRELIEDAVNRLKDSDIVGFSTYVWNHNYNKVLARELKKANPNILLIGGGPEYPIEKSNIFEVHPIDVCVKLEGEIAFKSILEEYLNSSPNYKQISGILINENGVAYDTGKSLRIDNLDDIPSPYLTGMFDELMKRYPDVRWNVTIETNRGCPYACTFCDWGSLTYNKEIGRAHV